MTYSIQQLMEYAKHNIDFDEQEKDVLKTDCDTIVYLLEHCNIYVPKENVFSVNIDCVTIQPYVISKRIEKYRDEILNSGLADGEEALAYSGGADTNHTSAQWESVISLGISGLKKTISQYAKTNSTDEDKKRFYTQIERVYDACLSFIARSSEKARSENKIQMADGFSNLTENAPSNLFEAMQTLLMYYKLQQYFDGTNLRTLGRIDKLFYPFYIKENREYADKLVADFIKEIDGFKIGSNLPFAVGGRDENGNDAVNELSYSILEAYKNAETSNVKLHLLCSRKTPRAFIESAFSGIRNGDNSIVFMSDEKVIESLIRLGEKPSDAANYSVVGCYECGGKNELACSCNARVNLTKALELALNNGRDMLTGKQIGLENDGCFASFESLFSEFARQTEFLCSCAMKETDIYEAHYNRIHSSPILSGTYTSCLEKGKDAFCQYGAKYNNSSVNAIGLGTTVDSLAAIRKLVYEDKTLTISELSEILKSNWKDNEQLRLTVKNKFPKFGVGNKKTDELAAKIVDILANAVSGKPNVKGGVYRLGLFSINWRWEFGEKTAASADGRLRGETLSQNTSASFGADKEGATAHLLSAAAIDSANTPNGSIVDIDLHSSAVCGENGLNALYSTLKTFFQLGGFAVHYNVLNTEVLKAAKLNPEAYPNLQVRLCGWNVLFSSLSEKEKDEFIARSEKD